MFQKRDCTLIEINPLAETNDGEGDVTCACMITTPKYRTV